MAAFHFKLSGVLEHRKNIEEEKQRALAAVLAQMQALKTELSDLDSVARSAISDLRDNRLTGQLDLSFLAAHRRFTGSVQRKALAIAQKMALVQRQIDEARAALAEAAKQRKIIEKLRERQLQRWQDQQKRQEAEELDDIGMQLAFRQLGESQSVDSQNAPAIKGRP
jgi:flagellar FliJ protein